MEAEMKALCHPPVLKLLGRHKLHHVQVVGRGLQVLPKGHDVHAHVSQVVQRVNDLVIGLPCTEIRCYFCLNQIVQALLKLFTLKFFFPINRAIANFFEKCNKALDFQARPPLYVLLTVACTAIAHPALATRKECSQACWPGTGQPTGGLSQAFRCGEPIQRTALTQAQHDGRLGVCANLLGRLEHLQRLQVAASQRVSHMTGIATSQPVIVNSKNAWQPWGLPGTAE